jgi:hypothetical protein
MQRNLQQTPSSERSEHDIRQPIILLLFPISRCLAACKPGSSIRALHELSVKLTSEALQQLKLAPQVKQTISSYLNLTVDMQDLNARRSNKR